jgi:thioredoxin-related protein
MYLTYVYYLMVKNAKFILVGFIFLLSSFKVTLTTHDKLAWMNMSELKQKMKSDSKPVLIDLYTNWCYWCKVMDKKTYTNSKVIAYITDHFYAVKLDAETKDIIEWKNNSYNYNENYKVNDFTMYVTSGQPGFPTTVIFTDDHSDPISIQGFLEPKEMEPILKYFGDGAYKTESFEVFKTTFKSSW